MSSVPDPLQTVQQTEFWGAIMALQACWLGHQGIDNHNMVWAVARLLDHGSFSKPLPSVKDGDLILVVQKMILARGPDILRG